MATKITGGPRSSRLFEKYLLSYAAILLIPSVFAVVIYAVSASVIEESARKSSLAILEQTRDVVDTRLAELDSTAKQIGLSPRAQSVLYMGPAEEGSPSQYTIWSAWKELPNYALANSFISSYFIIPRKAGVVLTADTVMPNDRAQYERTFKYADWSFERWTDFLFSSAYDHRLLPGATLRMDGQAKRGTYYLRPIPFDATRGSRGAFLVFIDESSLARLMRRLDTGSRGLAFIADEEGRLVASVAGERCTLAADQAALLAAKGEARSLERGGLILSTTKSELTRWSYVSVLPSDMVLAPARRARNIAFVILGLGLATGLVAAVAMAGRSAKPIYELATKIGGALGGSRPTDYRDEIEYLGDALAGLVEKDEGLRLEVERQLPVLRSDLTRRLLFGLYGGEGEALALAASARVDLGGRSFAAGAIRIEGYGQGLSARVLDELQVLRAAIKEALREAEGAEGFAYEPDDTSLALLFIFPEREAEDSGAAAARLLEGIAARLESGYRARLSYSSQGAASLTELPVAYVKARRAADSSGSPRTSATESSIGRSPSAEASFSLAIETELRLLATIKGGDERVLDSIMAELQRENLVERELSDEAFSDFASALRVALVRGFGEAGAAAAEQPVSDREDRRQWFERQGRRLRALRGSFESSRRSERKELARAIEARLAEIYDDPSLTIYAVAKEYGYSESAFYHLFRELFGQSFSDYLEALRIRQACARLGGRLGSERAMIKDIGAAVGFASDTTFRRAFHRVMGLSPSEYLRAVSTAARSAPQADASGQQETTAPEK